MQIARLIRTAATVTTDAAKSFTAGEPFQLAAALSYYTLLSMAPQIGRAHV